MQTNFVLADFISLRWSKNGETANVLYTDKNKENIYKFLTESGVIVIRWKKRKCYFLLGQPISEAGVKDMVFDKIKNLICEPVNKEKIIEALYKIEFIHIPSKSQADLSKEELHSILLSLDDKYKDNDQKDRLHIFLRENNFVLCTEGDGRDLYYKETEIKNTYLVLVEYTNAVDLLVAKIPPQQKIDKLGFLSGEMVKACFDYLEHFYLIEEFMQDPL